MRDEFGINKAPNSLSAINERHGRVRVCAENISVYYSKNQHRAMTYDDATIQLVLLSVLRMSSFMHSNARLQQFIYRLFNCWILPVFSDFAE